MSAEMGRVFWAGRASGRVRVGDVLGRGRGSMLDSARLPSITALPSPFCPLALGRRSCAIRCGKGLDIGAPYDALCHGHGHTYISALYSLRVD